MRKVNHCFTCNKPISQKAKFCRVCFHASRKGSIPWNKDKKTTPTFCIDCGVSVQHRRVRCRACYVKSRKGKPSPNKGMRGLKRTLSEKTREKYRTSLTGSNNPGWKGGKIIVKGYVHVRNSKHPNNVSGYVPEHRLVMEAVLGRYLNDWELVHHKNTIKHDNRPENLTIITRKTHHGAVLCPYCNREFEIK